MSDSFEEELADLSVIEANDSEMAQLWVVSYSDFMTILMIFFLMLFAHRVWEKKTAWENARVEQLRAVRQTQRGMVERLARMADIDVQAQRINIHLPGSLLFDAGHADLRDSAKMLLAQIAPELAAFKGEIVVEGHTDNLGADPHSLYKSNWELSVARSFSVIECLTSHGVDPAHMAARGYGPYRPRSPNDTAAHRAENRRIEIVLLNPQKAAL